MEAHYKERLFSIVGKLVHISFEDGTYATGYLNYDKLNKEFLLTISSEEKICFSSDQIKQVRLAVG